MTVSKLLTENNLTIFRLAGKVIAPNLASPRAGIDGALLQKGARIVVNLKDVQIIDSDAVGFLLSRSKTAEKRGIPFKICEARLGIKRLIAMSGKLEEKDISGPEEEALRWVAHSQ